MISANKTLKTGENGGKTLKNGATRGESAAKGGEFTLEREFLGFV